MVVSLASWSKIFKNDLFDRKYAIIETANQSQILMNQWELWMNVNDFELFWMIRNNHVMDNPFWTSTFWWIEIKNLFSTDGYPMMIMTKFMKNYRPILDTCNEVWNLNVSQKSLEIHEYSGIWNAVITVIKIFSPR